MVAKVLREEERGEVNESPRVLGRVSDVFLQVKVKTICLNYSKVNSGSKKAVHLSRYVEKDEAEEKNKLWRGARERHILRMARRPEGGGEEGAG